MKLQLIMLPQPILVSDEKIKEGDYLYENISGIFGPYEKGDVVENPKRIIAGIPELYSISYSDEASKTLQERCGWVDVEKEFEKWENTIPTPIKTVLSDFALSHTYPVRGVLRNMFKAAQSINEKKFSEIDLYDFGLYLTSMATKEHDTIRESLDCFMLSLSQPKVFDCLIEMEANTLPIDDDGLNFIGLKPKITNNSIKILKVLI